MKLIDTDEDTEWYLEDDGILEDEMASMDIGEEEENVDESYSQFTEDDFSKCSILCIDIGVHHLGLAALICDHNTWKFDKIIGVDLINITEYIHPDGVSIKDCPLEHSRTFTDWMEHVFVYYECVFTRVEKILIERQPPGGFVAVEQLIFSKYRDKCELIAPNSVHKFFHIGGYDYEGRKEKVVEIARKYMELPLVRAEFESFERKHDMADAICFGIFWLSKKHEFYLMEENIKRINNLVITHGVTFDEWLKQFEYNPNS
jgi:hypothetical protein